MAPVAAPAEPIVEPASLAVAADAAELALPRAIGLATRGDLRAALEALSTAKHASAEAAAELERETARLQALEAYRRQVLEQQRAQGKSLRIGAVNGRVVELDDAQVILEASSKKRTTIPLTEVTPEVLVRLQKQPDLEALPGPSLAYAWLLIVTGPLRENTEAWARKSAGTDAGALFDESARYDALIARDEAAALLLQLASTAVPRTAPEAAAQLPLIAGLLGRHAADELVAARAPLLEGLARQALGVGFDLDPFGALGVHAKREFLDPGRVRLSYDFSSAAQAEDFEPVDLAYLKQGRDTLGALSARKDPARFEVRDGHLLMGGAVAKRSRFRLAAPFKVEYTMRWIEKNDFEDKCMVIVGMCDDGQGQVLRSHDIGWLAGAAEQSKQQKTDGAGIESVMGYDPIHMLFEHDGKLARTSRDGKPIDEVAPGSLTHGALLLWIHADLDLRVDSLVVEAALDGEWLAAERSRHIGEGLAALRSPESTREK